MRCKPFPTWSETSRYTLLGALFGFCFPLGSIFFLYLIGDLPDGGGLRMLLVEAHARYHLLYIIDTAPFFLGLFARFAGIRQDRIRRFSSLLEQEVADKTESLRAALEEARKANEMIAHLAEHDTLTGLFNRRRFQRDLEFMINYSCRYRHSFALLFIDLDNFKAINDMHGHAWGDRYLVRVGEVLTEAMRSTDCVARLGGDEFALLLPETEGEGAEMVARKILSRLNQCRVAVENDEYVISASVGLALYPNDGEDPEELVAHADTAMYQAKEAGRNCWRRYQEGRPGLSIEERTWELRLRRALETESLRLGLTPLADWEDGRRHGFAASIHIEDREGKCFAAEMAPNHASRFVLGEKLDRWLARKVVNQLQEQWTGGLEIFLPVSLETLGGKEFLPFLREQVETARVKPAKVVLAIEAQVVIDNLGLARAFLRRATALGFTTGIAGLAPTHLCCLKPEELAVQWIGFAPQMMEVLQAPGEWKAGESFLHQMREQGAKLVVQGGFDVPD
ncbi:MAG: diguanylate cyclase [Desulfuromonadales bacterium]|nr:diguanylate cyclase [Desulfuromonadales bacterium]